MFDLIGFWFFVAVITAAMLSIFFFPIWWLAGPLVKGITEDEDKARKASRWVFNEDIVAPWIFGKRANPYVFNFSWVSSLSLWMVFGMTHGSEPGQLRYSEHTSDLVLYVSVIAEFLSPVGSVVAPIVIAYYVTMFVGRKIYKIAVRVNEVLDKVKDS
jgi:hypothetical protein